MIGYIYLTTNLINNKIYIGKESLLDSQLTIKVVEQF